MRQAGSSHCFKNEPPTIVQNHIKQMAPHRLIRIPYTIARILSPDLGLDFKSSGLS